MAILGTVTSQMEIAINKFAEIIDAGQRLDQKTVHPIMTEIYGSASSGKWTGKLSTDLIESAMVKTLLRHPPLRELELSNLQNLVPHHQMRSEEQMQLQQFSTPLELADLVSRAGQLTSSDILLEPSAGTGLLPAVAINQSGYTPKLILNEFSKLRREMLAVTYPNAEISGVDAEWINDTLPGAKPTLVLMNPPFSVSIGRSKRNADACFKHVRSSLLKLQAGGRLVAIVANWLSPEKHPQFFKDLPGVLRLSMFLPGKFYRFHGTSMDCRLLVFDKTPTDELPLVKSLEKYESLYDLRKAIDDNVPPRLKINQQSPVMDSVFEELPLFQASKLFAELPLFQIPIQSPNPASDQRKSLPESHPIPLAKEKSATNKITIIKPETPPVQTGFGELVRLKYTLI